MNYLSISENIDTVFMDVVQALLPLVVFFLIMQALSLKLPKN